MSREFEAMKRLSRETRMSVKQAARHFPWRPGETTVRRYAKQGLWSPVIGERIYLEAYREGRSLVTSAEAIERFCIIINGGEAEYQRTCE